MKLKKVLLYVLGGASLIGVGVAIGNENCRRAIAEGAKKGANKVNGWFQKKESESQPSEEKREQQPRDEKPRYEKPRYNNNNEKPRYNNGQQNQEKQ